MDCKIKKWNSIHLLQLFVEKLLYMFLDEIKFVFSYFMKWLAGQNGKKK